MKCGAQHNNGMQRTRATALPSCKAVGALAADAVRSAFIFRDMKIRIGDIIGGCFISVWILVILLFGVNALLGLFIGEIYLPDKKGGGGTLHGATARIVSLIILVISAFILSTLWRAWRRGRRVYRSDLPIDRDLERMRERRARQIDRRADMMREVKRREGAGADDEDGAS